MTKLEAVNFMLAAVGESPVTDITTTTNVDVIAAVTALDNATTEEQLKELSFNVDTVTLTPVSHVCSLPTGAVALAGPDDVRYSIVAGTQLCYREDYPTVTRFNSNLSVNVVVPRIFTALPPHAQTYIRMVATVALVNDLLSDSGKLQEWYRKMRVAIVAFAQAESKINRRSLIRN